MVSVISPSVSVISWCRSGASFQTPPQRQWSPLGLEIVTGSCLMRWGREKAELENSQVSKVDDRAHKRAAVLSL